MKGKVVGRIQKILPSCTDQHHIGRNHWWSKFYTSGILQQLNVEVPHATEMIDSC